MATGNLTISGSPNVATLEVDERPNTVELTSATRGFLVNGGESKVYVSVNSAECGIKDVQNEGTVGVFPGGVLPMPGVISRFSFQTERGRSVLYWCPGDNPPTVGDSRVSKVKDDAVVELLSECKALLAEIRDGLKKE